MASNNVGPAPKRLPLLRGITGGSATRAAMLYATNDPSNLLALHMVQDGARRMNIEIRPFGLTRADELTGAFAAMRTERIEMLVVAAGVLADSNARAIADLAAQDRPPALYGAPEFVEAGGLMSYSTDFVVDFRAAASYVDKILKGARPQELPIEQSSRYLMVLNAKAARALGLSVPALLRMPIDRIVD